MKKGRSQPAFESVVKAVLLSVNQCDEIVHEQNGAVCQAYDGDNHGCRGEFFVAFLALDGLNQSYDA